MALRAQDLIDEAIDALVRADTARLEELSRQAPAMARRMSDRERCAAMGQHRALGRLIGLTQRNLKLLGRDPSGAGGYGPRRG
jgi:hypothetical protein